MTLRDYIGFKGKKHTFLIFKIYIIAKYFIERFNMLMLDI